MCMQGKAESMLGYGASMHACWDALAHMCASCVLRICILSHCNLSPSLTMHRHARMAQLACMYACTQAWPPHLCAAAVLLLLLQRTWQSYGSKGNSTGMPAICCTVTLRSGRVNADADDAETRTTCSIPFPLWRRCYQTGAVAGAAGSPPGRGRGGGCAPHRRPAAGASKTQCWRHADPISLMEGHYLLKCCLCGRHEGAGQRVRCGPTWVHRGAHLGAVRCCVRRGLTNTASARQGVKPCGCAMERWRQDPGSVCMLVRCPCPGFKKQALSRPSGLNPKPEA